MKYSLKQEQDFYKKIYYDLPILHASEIDGTYNNNINGVYKLGWMQRTEKAIGWLENGLFHRENKPAIISLIGNRQEWYENGLLHRIDGPAFITPELGKHFYIKGFHYGDEKKYWNNELVKFTAINKLF